MQAVPVPRLVQLPIDQHTGHERVLRIIGRTLLILLGGRETVTTITMVITTLQDIIISIII